MKRSFLVHCTVLALLASVAHAADDNKSTRVPVPVLKINTDKGEKCVEPTEEMRRNHLEKILHQRDQTVHEGIRTTKHSHKNCIDCHADPVTNSVLGKDGFCSSCHIYASVKMDCFECHSAKREAGAAAPPTVSTVRALDSGVARKNKTNVSAKDKKP